MFASGPTLINTTTTRTLFAFALGSAAALLTGAASRAQSTSPAPVYESHDKSGPVFSDRPTPGATRIELGPPNTIDTGPPPPQTATPPPVAPPYKSLAILSPANGSTIHSNTGSFKVKGRAVPSLRAGTGDRFRLALDGNVLPHDYGSATIQLVTEDWRDASAAGNGSHTLQLSVVDAQGRVLIESAPVTFYAHRAAKGHHR